MRPDAFPPNRTTNPLLIMEKNETAVALGDLTREEAELVMTAVLLLAERTADPSHARTLRRMGMRIDSQLPD